MAGMHMALGMCSRASLVCTRQFSTYARNNPHPNLTALPLLQPLLPKYAAISDLTLRRRLSTTTFWIGHSPEYQSIHVACVTDWHLPALQPVILFSKPKQTFWDTLIRKMLFSIIRMNDFRYKLSDISPLTKSLIAMLANVGRAS